MKHSSALLNEPGIDVVTDERIQSGVTVAHRRTAGKYDPKSGAWPTSRWPACIVRASGVKDDGWVQYSAGWAAHLGAVPCTATACFGNST